MRPALTDKTAIVKRVLVVATLVVVSALVLLPSRGPTSARAERGAAQANAAGGPDDNVCATCHEQVVRDFAKTVHGKAPDKWGKGGDYNSTQTCQSCHGDGTEHINAGGDPTKIRNPAKLRQKESVETCQNCHSQMNEHAQWRGSRHESAGLTCLSCHSPHHPAAARGSEAGGQGVSIAAAQSETKLLKFRSEADTCYSCHTDVRKSQYQRSTHLFRNEDREQKMSCSTCHEPHGGIGERMMRTGSVNETCYTCHAEYRGPFLYEHAPVRESCANCHRPHGSNNINLLKQRAPMLCQQCHIQGRHQTVPGRPNSAFNTNRSCTNCHSQVHGSNHPSGINLQR
jgi:DmsE family decaheme c-type cytochrome